MEENRLISNVTDLLECRDVKNLMTVNGFSPSGSAYDRFRILCLCAERQPHAPIILRLQSYLWNAFGCKLTLNGTSCEQIW